MIRQIVQTPPDSATPSENRVVVLEEEISPEELAASHARHTRFRRNSAWLEAHGREVHAQHRGRHICVAGEELFVADTPREVLALAKAAHPGDDGRLLTYIHPAKGPRIYGHFPPMIVLPDYDYPPIIISYDPPE